MLLNCSDDCVSRCGAMGCFIWWRKYTCLCFGFFCCPCCWHFCSSPATRSIKQFHIDWFPFWIARRSSLGDNHTVHGSYQQYRSIDSLRDGSDICVRMILIKRITHSIFNSFIFFSHFLWVSVLHVEYIFSVFMKRIYVHIFLTYSLFY